MSATKFIIYGSGIFFSYLLFGIFQERITRNKHEPGGERFTFTMTLVLLQCIINAIFARIMLSTFMKQGKDKTSWKHFALSSLTYLVAMVSSNNALQYVSYPTQVVGKSCKPIPIMIMGVLFSRKKHSAIKYFFVSLIVAGVAIFMYKKDLKANSTNSNDITSSVITYLYSLGKGELLLLLSLGMDGLTGAVQERMKSDYQTKSLHMMFKMNLWSSFYLAIATGISGEIYQFLAFIERHPTLIYEISMFGLLSALGQLFIFLTIAEFGPLPCSIITTTRKFFTVLFSVFLLGNHLTTNQWYGTVLVFSGLTLDSVWGKNRSPQNDKKVESTKKQLKND